MSGQNGKGSKRRPCLVSRQQEEENWKRTFKKKEKKEKVDEKLSGRCDGGDL